MGIRGSREMMGCALAVRNASFLRMEDVCGATFESGCLRVQDVSTLVGPQDGTHPWCPEQAGLPWVSARRFGESQDKPFQLQKSGVTTRAQGLALIGWQGLELQA